MLAKYTVIHRS